MSFRFAAGYDECTPLYDNAQNSGNLMNLLSTEVGFRFDNSRRVAKRTSIGVAVLTLIATLSVARADDFDSSTLSGTVTDAAGRPIAGAEVWLNNFGGQLDPAQLAARRWKTITDKNGKYELTLRYSKSEPFIAKQMYAEVSGYIRGWWDDDISLQGGNNATIDFHLDKGEVIAGVIRLPPSPMERDIPAEAKAGLSKARTISVDGPSVSQMPPNAKLHRTDDDGKFEFYVPQGEYTLQVMGFYDGEPLEWKGIRSGQRGLELTVPPFEWTPENVGKAFDELWDVMDQNYSYFFLKKDVDWTSLRDKYRPVAVKAMNAEELSAVLKDMLAPLNDMHVWISTPTGIVSTAKAAGYIYNGNRDVTLLQLGDRVECGKFATVGKTKQDGFGYFLMLRQSAATEADVKTAVEAIRKLRDAPGFIVDLRTANGGAEPLALKIASLFCAKETVYAKSKYRDGPGHEQFGKVYDRLLSATPDAYIKPVVCLIGPGAVSSGEGFVEMMKCLPHVTTIGMPTRGASGNPDATPVARTGLMVYHSSWVDMLPSGETFEGVGIAPEIRVDLPRAAYAGADPTLEKGLEILRAKLAAAK
jgi:Peptidase family S41/Tricorn protease C1 domain/Carboxypeptidase regulatory-like domain